MDDADVGVVAHRLPGQVDEAVKAAAGKPGVNEVAILKRFDNVLKNCLFLLFGSRKPHKGYVGLIRLALHTPQLLVQLVIIRQHCPL